MGEISNSSSPFFLGLGVGDWIPLSTAILSLIETNTPARN